MTTESEEAKWGAAFIIYSKGEWNALRCINRYKGRGVRRYRTIVSYEGGSVCVIGTGTVCMPSSQPTLMPVSFNFNASIHLLDIVRHKVCTRRDISSRVSIIAQMSIS